MRMNPKCMIISSWILIFFGAFYGNCAIVKVQTFGDPSWKALQICLSAGYYLVIQIYDHNRKRRQVYSSLSIKVYFAGSGFKVASKVAVTRVIEEGLCLNVLHMVYHFL